MFFGQFDSPVDEFLYYRYFHGIRRIVRNRVCLEYGSFDDFPACSRFFERSLGWKCVRVGSVPDRYRALSESNSNAVPLSAALSDSSEAGLPALGFAELLFHYGLFALDLLVLDQDGSDLNLIESMAGNPSAPCVFVTRADQANRQRLLAAAEAAGYALDVELFSLFFFVRKDAADVWKIVRSPQSEAYLEAVSRSLSLLTEGRLVPIFPASFSPSRSMFASLAANSLSDEKLFCLYSLAGVEGKSCDSQKVYYRLTGKSGRSFLIQAARQPRPDYAAWRGDLYLYAGNRMIADPSLFEESEYTVELILQQDGFCRSPAVWSLMIGSGGALSLTQLQD